MRFEILIELFAEPFYVDIDDVGAWIEVIIPDTFQNRHASANPSGGSHQKLQKAKLGSRQCEEIAVQTSFATSSVQLESSRLQYTCRISLPTTLQPWISATWPVPVETLAAQ